MLIILQTNGCIIISFITSTVTLSAEDIGKFIRDLDSSKAHEFDNIIICMLIICGDSVCIPLEIIFKQTLRTGAFLSEWKRRKIVPIYKKSDK